jgi:hypothetical protein
MLALWVALMLDFEANILFWPIEYASASGSLR